MSFWIRLPISSGLAAIVGAITYVSTIALRAPYLFGEPLWLGFLYQVIFWTIVALLGVAIIVVPGAIAVSRFSQSRLTNALTTLCLCVVVNATIYFGLGGYINATLFTMFLRGLLPGICGGFVFVSIQYPKV